jgi:hypothetical protein
MVSGFMQHLRSTVEGLAYPTEPVGPFRVFRWPSTSGSARDAVQIQTNSEAIAEKNIDAFFIETTEHAQSASFVALKRTLVANLPDLHAFCVGVRPEIDVYLIGRGSFGEWIVLQAASNNA